MSPFCPRLYSSDHDIAEIVDLSVTYKANDNYTMKSKTKFTFTLDMTVLLAQSLAMNACNSAALKQLEVMYGSLLLVTADELLGLDQRLATAFCQLELPNTWSLANNQGKFSSNRQNSIRAFHLKNPVFSFRKSFVAQNKQITLFFIRTIF